MSGEGTVGARLASLRAQLEEAADIASYPPELEDPAAVHELMAAAGAALAALDAAKAGGD